MDKRRCASSSQSGCLHHQAHMPGVCVHTHTHTCTRQQQQTAAPCRPAANTKSLTHRECCQKPRQKSSKYRIKNTAPDVFNDNAKLPLE